MEVVRLDFEVPVWRVMPDHTQAGLAIELRSREQKFVEFMYLDLLSSERIRLDSDGDWWKGLEDVQDKKVLLHGYQNAGMPIKQGIYVFEAGNGQLLWQQINSRFKSLTKDEVCLINENGEENCYTLDSGNERQAKPLTDTFKAFEASRREDLKFPKVILDGNQEFSLYHKEIAQHWEVKPQIQIDFLAHKASNSTYRVFNFYEKNPSGTWNQYLGILKDSTPIFHRELGQALRGISLDPFFLFQNFLIWIEDGKGLCYLRF